jgi:signal transduction histidine kinase
LAANNQFVGNLIFLGIAVILLLTSIFFIFRTASRERELAMRQAGFLANVTHELKTPLAVMQAAGENLADGRVRDSDRLAHYGHHIHEEAVRLSRMIDKLLNVARSDAGQILIHRRPTRLVDIVHEFYNSSESYFKDRGFEVRIRCESKDFIHADPESILTILSNLIENAIKYSAEDKRVIIHIFRVKERLLLEVEDFGIGIPANKQKYIFDKFYRVEDPLTATTKGHGLGLSIVKHLTQLNGGKIELRSVYGTGSTFTLSFPLWVPEPTSVPENISSQESTPEYAVQG